MTRSTPWYKDAVIYQLHVRSFFDSTGDGVGDFRGLAQKLDYLQDLGATALWLLPFYPSPRRDDGYDIADYVDVHPDYGSLDAFREFLDEAHRRDLRVITELVLNHTSDRHPWFQRARRAPAGSVERDFYVWSETPEKYREPRVIFQDFESSNWSFDPVARAYYWHRFYSHQPDLNYDNPAVWEAVFPIVDFWFGMGVDGMRLDAIAYLYEREGTTCENLPETHAFLRALRRHVDERFSERMFLAEANQWPEIAASYFGAGDECQMAFHFPLMPRLYLSIHSEDRFPIVDVLRQTPPIPAACQWAVFLRNHDELTLEMVTDEERDSMYRAYAPEGRARINSGIRRRLAPLMSNNRRKIELINGLLFSLPGTPVVYYGDEIGMGDNIYLGDRDSVRTPMQWSSDRNAGFSRANPQQLFLPIVVDPEYHYEAINVEAQQANPSSLLWWFKRLIHLRRDHPALSRGAIRFLESRNRKLLAYVRTEGDDCVLVVANLSRFVQHGEIELADYAGRRPVELFGRTRFPPVDETPYRVMLGPHAFLWCSLPEPSNERRPVEPPTVEGIEAWERLFEPNGRGRLRAILEADRDETRACEPRGDVRQDAGRAAGATAGARDEVDEAPRRRRVRLLDQIRLEADGAVFWLVVAAREMRDADQRLRLTPIGFLPDDGPDSPPVGRLLARLVGPRPGRLYDASTDPRYHRALVATIAGEERRPGGAGRLVGRSFDPAPPSFEPSDWPVAVGCTEQNNLTAACGRRWFFKAFRSWAAGTHPEAEAGPALADAARRAALEPDRGANRGTTPLAPHCAGVVEYVGEQGESVLIGVLHAWTPHESDGWQHALDAAADFLERTAARPAGEPAPAAGADDWPSDYRRYARRIGERLAELHVALASVDSPAFKPEPFSLHYQRSIYQSLRRRIVELAESLARSGKETNGELRAVVDRFLAQHRSLTDGLRTLLDRPFGGLRIRTHGDCHLKQLLFTGVDYLFIDWEGDPRLALSERRIKRSPLRDVASMLASFDAAVHSVLAGVDSERGRPGGLVRSVDRSTLAPWAERWAYEAGEAFLQGYLADERTALLLPTDPADVRRLLDLFVVERLSIDASSSLDASDSESFALTIEALARRLPAA